MHGLTVRGTFSAIRAWRPTVGSGYSRTLNVRNGRIAPVEIGVVAGETPYRFHRAAIKRIAVSLRS